MANQAQFAADILTAVGGKENVQSVTHCMTRLRFVLKDEALASDEALKAISGVISVVRAGGQVQIIIGTTVDKTYDEVCKIGGFLAQDAVDENPDGIKKKLTPGQIVNNILGAISGSITPVLPMFIAAGIFKMIATLFGPKNLAILGADSDLFILCNLVSDASYYFMPFMVAFSAAKKFNCSAVLSMIIVSVMVHPTMLGIVSAGEPFTVFGIPMQLVSYTQAVFPIIIIVWIQSYVEKWLKKIMPDMLRTLGIPVLTTAIMLPLSLCLFGPICSIVMGGVSQVILWMTNNIGLPTIVVVGAFWSLVVSFGMHVPIMSALLPTWMEMGYDAIVSPATIASISATLGVELSYALRAGTKENRSYGWSCFVTGLTNVNEPYIYGIYFRDRKAFVIHTIGAATGALVMGILGAKVVMFTGVGFAFLNFLRFGEFAMQGLIGMLAGFGVSFALGLIFGFEGSGKLQKKDKANAAKA